jgi:general secretion pathway protein A
MYQQFFGFREPPFALTPNPDFLFMSGHHQEAFAHLLYAIDTRAGFIELSGEVGAGKTTIIRTLLGQLAPERYRTALIFNPALSPVGLLQEVCREFGLTSSCTETRELHQLLNEFLLAENGAGRTVVLVIDEAQNLSVEVLEQVRLISNLETEREKLIQIVLVGQPELKKLLGRQELRQLRQRITVRYHLQPMEAGDVHLYIRHRIKIAAEGREPVIFSAGAIKRIARFSGGLPRLINGACDRALLLAYTTECREISSRMAALAIVDLLKEEEGEKIRIGRIAITVLLVVVAGVAGVLLTTDLTAPQAPEPLPVAAPVQREANGVEILQGLLKKAGHYAGKPDGLFDDKTEKAIRNFQRAESLTVDGKPGGQTLSRLYQRAGGVFLAYTSRHADAMKLR